jgi:predicted RNase H-like HicB family nuclease
MRRRPCRTALGAVFCAEERQMTKLRYVHWQEEDYHLGYFEDYPDYLTQGKTPAELLENLEDLYRDIHSGQIPYIRKVDELILAG